MRWHILLNLHRGSFYEKLQKNLNRFIYPESEARYNNIPRAHRENIVLHNMILHTDHSLHAYSKISYQKVDLNPSEIIVTETVSNGPPSTTDNNID